MNYVATFYTHAAALLTNRSLQANGHRSQMGPVPRALSSSCGTCVMYTAEDACLALMDQDVEAVYLVKQNGYETLLKNE